ncbi:MAG: TerL [Deltaproteobacteria bacterium]|nr:MAG: TerL [Deltaproteobacteria bacterium]RLC88376.1 MAG: TerL [Chloroflexota bacterium]
MTTHKYIFNPPGEVLKKYYLDRSPVSIITGPLGSAKTTTTCYKKFALMREQAPNAFGIRPTRSIAIRNTYGELLSTTAKDFTTIFSDLGVFKQGGKEPPSFKMRFRLQDGTIVEHEMLFIALDRPKHVKKLRGHQVTWFWLSEVKELPKDIIDMADLRHGRYPSMLLGEVLPTYSGMIGDTNQCDEDHWLYDFQEVKKPAGDLPDWSFFVQPGGVVQKNGKWALNKQAENLNNLPPGYYDKRIQGKSDDWIKVNLGNQYGFVMDGKPVHPEYNDSVHSVDNVDYLTDVPIVLGIDFGRTPACAILQQIGESWYCLDEFVTVNMSAAKFAPALLVYLNRNYPGCAFIGWGDPAGANKGEVVEHSAIETLNATGIPCEPCETQDPLQRRSAVANPLTELGVSGKSRLLICKKAKTIRKGLAGKFCYRRLQVAGDEKYMDVPDKNAWSHPVEALEYGLMGEGEGVSKVIEANRHGYEERQSAVY